MKETLERVLCSSMSSPLMCDYCVRKIPHVVSLLAAYSRRIGNVAGQEKCPVSVRNTIAQERKHKHEEHDDPFPKYYPRLYLRNNRRRPDTRLGRRSPCPGRKPSELQYARGDDDALLREGLGGRGPVQDDVCRPQPHAIQPVRCQLLRIGATDQHPTGLCALLPRPRHSRHATP